MWKLILVYFTLVPKITQGQSVFRSPYRNRCGDCEDLEKLIIPNAGHYCHPEDKNALEKNYTKEASEHKKCMPPVYQKIYPIRHYCCFWSPQLGCQILVGKLYFDIHGRSCAPCSSHCPIGKSMDYNYGNRPTIPLAMPFLALLQMLVSLNQLG